MQQKIFNPKYTGKTFFGLILMIPLELFLLGQLLSGKDTSPVNIFGAIFFGLILLITPYAFIKRIVFDTHSFSVEKYIWPTRIIEYSDVVDIGATMIKIRNGNLGLQSMMNADELRDALRELIELGKINRYQIENKVVAQERISRKAVMPAVIVSFVLWGITLFVWPYDNSFVRDLGFLAFFVPVYIVMYLFLKNHVENQ